MLEAARAGASYAEVEAAGLAAVSPADVLPGVRELVDLVSLEVLLGDGTRLITLVDPLGGGQAPSRDGPGAIVPAEAGDARAATGAGGPARSVVRSRSRTPLDESFAFPRTSRSTA